MNAKSMALRKALDTRSFLILIFAAVSVVAVSCRRIIVWTLHHRSTDLSNRTLEIYNYAVNQINYSNSGFVRRGLGGMLFSLFDKGNVDLALAGFHVLSALWLAAPVCFIVYKLSKLGGLRWLWFTVVLALAPPILLTWSDAIGKTDILVAGFLAWAAVAAIHSRFLLSVAFVVAGALVHETAVIYGGPLLVSICATQWFERPQDRKAMAMAVVALPIIVVAILFLQKSFSAPDLRIIHLIQERTPLNQSRFDVSLVRDLAAFMTAGGARTIHDSQCASFMRPSIAVLIGGCVISLALYWIGLLVNSWRSFAVIALASLVPFTVMDVVAIDYGRWTSFALLCAWLAAAALQLSGNSPAPTKAVYIRAMVAFAVILAMGTGDYNTSSKLAHTVAARVWPGKSSDIMDYIDRCDPTWRAFTHKG